MTQKAIKIFQMISGLRQKVQPAKRKHQNEHRLAPMVDITPAVPAAAEVMASAPATIITDDA